MTFAILLLALLLLPRADDTGVAVDVDASVSADIEAKRMGVIDRKQ